MPKEITHWTICEKSIEIFQNLDRVSETVGNNTNLFFMGAIVFDSPYYGRGVKKDQFSYIADFFHGSKGENTIAPIIKLINNYEGEYFEGLQAFCLGIITHIITDSEYHPFVYYYTGNYYHVNSKKRKLAISNHRLFETVLDIFYIKQASKRKFYRLKNFIKNCEMPNKELLSIISLLFSCSNHTLKPEEIMRSILNHSAHQKKFINPFISKTVRVLNAFLGGRLSTSSSLFYPSIKNTDVSFFENDIIYIHPVTSSIVKTSLEKIERSALTKIYQFAEKFNACKNKVDILNVLESTIGPSLETGLIRSKVTEMNIFKNNEYFHQPHFFLKR